MDYEELEKVFKESELVCNPIDFVQRQFHLTYSVAKYLLERDKPKEEVE